MLRNGQRLIILLIALLSTGCLYYGQVRSKAPAPNEESVPIISEPRVRDYFAYVPISQAPEPIKTKDRGGYVIHKLRFPTHSAHFYLPKNSEVSPGVVVLPISHGDYHSRKMAAYLASHGLAVLRFKSRKEILAAPGKDHLLDHFEENLRSYVADILQGLDWMRRHPSIDPDRVGLVGISMGAIAGTIVLGLDPHIRVGVLILGGGDLAGILFSSKEKSIRRIRNDLEKKERLTLSEIQDRLYTQLQQLEPLRYANDRGTTRILMINAYFDRVIRRRNGMVLWEAYGKPSMIQIPTGHYSALIFTPYIHYKTLEYLKNHLGDG